MIRYQRMKFVTIIGAISDLVLGLLKIVFGVFGHSQALFADGIHSLSDLAVDVLVIVGAKTSNQLPDQTHPYGHGRVETVFAIILALVLSGVGVGIFLDSLHEIIHHHFLKPSLPVLIVAACSIIFNEFLFRYTLKTAEQFNSNLLRANAWHKRSDAWASIIVLVGITGQMMGIYYLDAVAAMIVALMIFKMSVSMIRNNLAELIEMGVDQKTLKALIQVIQETAGVKAFHQLRTRLIGGQILIDVHIQVDPRISVSESHFIADLVERNLLQYSNKMMDVVVHIDPEDDHLYKLTLHLPDRNGLLEQLKQRWRNIPEYSYLDKINLHYLNGKIEIEVFLSKNSHLDPLSFEVAKKSFQQVVQDISDIRDVKVYLS